MSATPAGSKPATPKAAPKPTPKVITHGTILKEGDKVPAHRSVSTRVNADTKAVETIVGGYTESAKKRAKILKKKPEDLTKEDYAITKKELLAIIKKNNKDRD